jgi:hypothetical protein
MATPIIEQLAALRAARHAAMWAYLDTVTTETVRADCEAAHALEVQTMHHKVLAAFKARPDDVERITLYHGWHMFGTGACYAYAAPPPPKSQINAPAYYVDCGMDLF